MAKLTLSFLFLPLFVFSVLGSVELASVQHARKSRARTFIEASCRSTRYPSLCVKCLSGYANKTQQSPFQLAQVALSVSLAKTRHTRAYVMEVASNFKDVKGRTHQDISDCLDQINDGVDRLAQSIIELRRMNQEGGDSDFTWRMSNIETWVSAALTDATTCVDGFSGRDMGKLKATIKGKVLNVAQVTSNALALVNRFAARHRATNKP